VKTLSSPRFFKVVILAVVCALLIFLAMVLITPATSTLPDGTRVTSNPSYTVPNGTRVTSIPGYIVPNGGYHNDETPYGTRVTSNPGYVVPDGIRVNDSI